MHSIHGYIKCLKEIGCHSSLTLSILQLCCHCLDSWVCYCLEESCTPSMGTRTVHRETLSPDSFSPPNPDHHPFHFFHSRVCYCLEESIPPSKGMHTVWGKAASFLNAVSPEAVWIFPVRVCVYISMYFNLGKKEDISRYE